MEVDAAHIVPRSMFGSDDARNGLALCKRHHWAFDKGMLGIDDDRKIVVPSVVADFPKMRASSPCGGRSSGKPRILLCESIPMPSSGTGKTYYSANSFGNKELAFSSTIRFVSSDTT